MEKGDLTYQIIGCAMLVHRKLKRGFMEYVYCRALAIEFRKAGIPFEREVWLPIHYDNLRIAFRRCDFYIRNEAMLEVKAKSELSTADMAQAINTLEQLNVKTGLVINFGAESLQYKHVFNNKIRPESDFEDVTPEMVGETDEDMFESRHYLPGWLVDKMQRDKFKRKS
ncbi:MAG TPA: GxxExxY protein [Saprospiraceae bacterium]|nr:GxxExxY protein [Saprospiraceae bacterium]HPI06388.1 GxxExxY protein [Saprospiraceae bacterium]